MQLARMALVPLLGLTCLVVAGLMLGPANGQARSTGTPADPAATSDETERRDAGRHTRRWRRGGQEAPGKATRVFKLQGPDARRVQETLATLFPDSVELAAAGQNQLVVTAPANVLSAIEQLLSELGRPQDSTFARRGFPWRASFGRANPPLAATPSRQDPRVTELMKTYNDLEQEIRALVETDTPGDQAELRTKIRDVTSRQFDLRQQVRKIEMERLRKRLDDVEETVRRREELKDKVVDRRVAELLGEDEELSWDPLGGPATEARERRLVPERFFEERLSPPFPRQRVPKTVYPALPSAQPGMSQSPAASPDAGVAGEDIGVPGLDGNVGRLSVIEAEKRAAFAEEELARMESLAKRSAVSQADLAAKRRAAELAQLALERARREHDARAKLLELELREAEAELAVRGRQLSASQPNDDREQLKLEYEKATFRVERAKTLIELHQGGVAEDGEGESEKDQPGEPKKASSDGD